MTSGLLPTYPGGWRCLVADPPWSFRDRGSRVAPDWKGRKAGGYSTMDAAAIASLPVRRVAADDALLFLWTTSAHLVSGEALRVVKAWGFIPKTTIAWVKVGASGKLQIGCGHYVRAAHELVLLCRRGRARVKVRDVPSVIFAPRTRHSAKPEALQQFAERLIDGPRLELFARRDRVGWVTWGDQLGQLTAQAGRAA